MDEILKRLVEIKAEAKALRESDEEGRLEKLRTLVAEQQSLELQIEEHNAFETLAKEVPTPVAESDEDAGDDEGEDAGEEKPEEADDAGEEEEAVEPESTRVPLAAAAAGAKPVDTDTPDEAAADPIRLVASGNVGGTTPGSVIESRDLERIHRAASSSKPGGGEVRAIFASMNVVPDGGAVLNESNTAEQNSAIMASASAGVMKPITAAAAFCGPDDVVLDICAAGTAERPVQGLFRTVPVRGKFRYMKTAELADTAAGIAVWEEADQIALDPDDPLTWKPCVDLSCLAETTVTPYAIPACVTLGTWQQLSAPEQIANFLTQMEKQYSKIAEQQLLDRIRAQSKVLSAGTTAGQGVWNILNAVLAHLESATGVLNRGSFEGYVLVAPYGFTAALAADEIMRGFSQNLAVARVQALLRENFGIRIVESWETDSTVDPSYSGGAAAIGALADGGAATPLEVGTHTPDRYPLYIFNPNAFVAGSSDVVEAGYHRDANMVRQNLVRYFWEGMEFLEKTCDHTSFVVELTNCPNGGASPLGDPIDCTTGVEL